MAIAMMIMILAGVSMTRLLTDADTEAMVQRVQPEERDQVGFFSLLLFFLTLFNLVVSLFLSYQLQVNVLLEKHKELRRKKSANSFRREGVTQVNEKGHTDTGVEPGLIPQRPQALNNSQQQTGNGELPPIGLIEEKEENSTAL